MKDGPGPASGATAVLRHLDFRRLWLANLTSSVGDRLVTVALALFIIDETGSATDLGLVLAAHSLPLVGFLLIGGVWADRLSRTRVMIASDLVRFALHAALAVLILSGAVEIWQLVVIEALFGTAEAFFRPAFAGLVPQTVPRSEIQPANALTTFVNNVAEFAGPALATALVLGVGAGCGLRARRRHLPRQRGFSRPGAAARARERRGAREPARRAARGLGRGALARLGMGDDRRLLRRAAVCLAPFFVLGPSSPRSSTAPRRVYGLWPRRSAPGRSPAR